jgi:superfamily I DNA/RNA helicase
MWTRGLNPEQVLAVQHSYGPLLVLAGAGSGKTTVLVARTGRLIADQLARPDQICVLTFTNKAARELKHRVENRLGITAKSLWASTFHSFCLKLLRTYHQEAGLPAHFGVIDPSDSQGLLKEILRDVSIAGKDRFDLDELLGLVNKVRMKEPLPPVDEDYRALAEYLAPKFEKKMEVLGVVDFDGLLAKPMELFESHPEVLKKVQAQYKFIMVDEFQDTNDLQMQLVESLAGSQKNICVVGDDDQAIYGWRGAKVANILDFPHRFKPCEVIRLERNYRSSPLILNAANELIAKNSHRHGKVLKSEGKFQNPQIPEAFVLENEEEECQFVIREIRNWFSMGLQNKDIAILYRSNSQGGLLEGHFRQNQIPYTVSGGTGFFDRKEIKDILAYLRMALTPNDVSLRRIINTPPRGIGDTSLEKMMQYSIHHKANLLQSFRAWEKVGLTAPVGAVIEQFFKNIQDLRQDLATSTDSAGAVLLNFLRKIGYRDFLLKSSKDPAAGDKKWVMAEILARVLDSFCLKGGRTSETFREFLDAMELRDEASDEEENKVQLMTLHACKGLEFPAVIIVGVEEDIIPHKTLGTNIDEERRLFYVGLTRAKEKLILTRVKSRTRYGALKPVSPSRFLLEISAQNLKDYQSEFRPVTADQRKDLLSGFLASLDKKSSSSSNP